jgi:hypothetical protein
MTIRERYEALAAIDGPALSEEAVRHLIGLIRARHCEYDRTCTGLVSTAVVSRSGMNVGFYCDEHAKDDY